MSEDATDEVVGFATRRGRCEIRDGILHVLPEADGGGTAPASVPVPTLVIAFGALGVALLVSGVLMLDASHPAGLVFPIAQALFGSWLLFAAWRSRGVSEATAIPVERISAVDEVAPYPGRRGHFVVHFRDEDDRRRRRLLMLPDFDSAQAAEDAWNEAAALLRAARAGAG